jgi:tRNA dimethylallyltransferase
MPRNDGTQLSHEAVMFYGARNLLTHVGNQYQDNSYNLIVILGPTASGKTRIAARLAKDICSEIVSADSRQVYRGMDMGTGKDLEQYVVDGVSIPYHLIDILHPNEEFSVFDYQNLFFRCFQEITSRNITPIMVGGTGLYIESVLKRYHMPKVNKDPCLRKELENNDMKTLVKRLSKAASVIHNTTDLLDRNRLIRAIEIAEYIKTHNHEYTSVPHITPLIVGIRRERAALRRRITDRLRQRLTSGMIDEVKDLHEAGVTWERMDYFGLEYRYIGLYLQGKIRYNDMFQKLNSRIHQFAKRQETWFRKMERNGIHINWLDGDDYAALRELIHGLDKRG